MSIHENFIIDTSVMDTITLPTKSANKEIKYAINYDENTKKYCIYRKLNIDPLSLEVMDSSYPVFKIYKIWDAYNGEFKENDPFGPLCFDPINLAIYFWTNRYVHLLKDSDDVNNISTDDGLGAGVNFIVNGKGQYPERYLWRIPVVDCYIEKTNSVKENAFLSSIPKMGPILLRKDIIELDCLVKKCAKLYPNRLSRIPDLLGIFDIYHIAIDPEPDISGIHNYESIMEARNMVNIDAAYQLVYDF